MTRQGDTKFLYKLRVDSLALRRRNVNARPTEYLKKIIAERRAEEGKATLYNEADTSSGNTGPVFQSEFENEKKDSAALNSSSALPKETVLQRSKLFDYRWKFSNDYIVSGVSNNILINRYQPYAGGNGPIQLGNGSNLNFTFRASVSDLMEDIKFIGGVRLGTNLRDNDYIFGFENFRKRFDWGVTYYRTINHTAVNLVGSNVNQYNNGQVNTNIYQFNGSYPLNEVKSLRTTIAYRRDRIIVKPFNLTQQQPDQIGLKVPDQVSKYALGRLEYVHDNTINPTQNIWHGLRYKVYLDINMPVRDTINPGFTYNFGFDARHYLPVYRNFIWAVRAAADFSWGTQKLIYYLGGADGWLNPKFNNGNRPDPDQSYAFQTLAVNLRGFRQNVANGNNAFVLNSELRLPVFSTLLNKPVNNAFLRNFQVVQFVDLGSAWNGKYDNFARPGVIYTTGDANNPVTLKTKAGGIGPFAGGYGFGVRSTLLGYFLKVDAGWPMDGLFKGKPIYYFALGLDF